jgi:L-asparaginase
MALRIFVTGGTFDKEYNELTGELFFQDSHIAEMLRKGRCRVDVRVRTLMMEDSLTLDDSDRDMMRTHCERCPEERIVITHGTDTMEATARLLASAGLPKTIVLTGAMIPYTFGSSDGLFNLGSALAYAQCLPHGVYVAMNGRCFRGDNVRKDRRTGTFETLEG